MMKTIDPVGAVMKLAIWMRGLVYQFEEADKQLEDLKERVSLLEQKVKNAEIAR